MGVLIGKKGKFVLKAPFTLYSTDGLVGQIVGVNFIQHMVSRGTNVEELVYAPVDYTDQYAEDYDDNMIIITIKTKDEKKYHIPESCIENLYADTVNMIDAFAVIHIGDFPADYDFSYIKTEIAVSFTIFTGNMISSSDVTISAQDSPNIFSNAEANMLTLKRVANIAGKVTDFGKLAIAKSDNKVLTSKLDSMEKSMFSFT